jgi:DNA-binding NtrC family response regulator
MEKDQPYHSQVMIIDNDKFIRESLGTFFNKTQLRLLIFKSASEGLNALKYQDIDVVVSDYFLPDMNGLTFLKKVAEEKPGISRVLMSTITNNEITLEITRAGIDKFIEKPISVASLEKTLKELEVRRLSKSFPAEKSNE